jgi:predicted DNA-binding transcriptional regulator AlpA
VKTNSGPSNDAAAIAAELLRLPEAAALLGISRRSLTRDVADGLIPRPVGWGGKTRWRRGELVAWIAAGCPPVAAWSWPPNGKET